MSVSLHLCQPGAGASCGACCGLYNFRDHSRAALTRQLARQTEALAPVPHTREAWGRAAQALRAERQAQALFPAVRVCPLLGFLDAGATRVGCLAHPRVTGGTDLRDCGAYTAEVCERFTCPSFSWLTEAQALLVRDACPDWYLYGLVVTDVELVHACLRLLERELGGPVAPERIRAVPRALEAARALFALKELDPDPDGPPRFGAFRPDPDGEPVSRGLDYVALGRHAAPEDDVVLCLGYAPRTGEELDAARARVHERVLALAGALSH